MPAFWDRREQVGQAIENSQRTGNQVYEAMNQPLLSPEILQSWQKMLQPYFQSQWGNLNQGMGNAMGMTGQGAGAFAAARGLANPGAFVNSAQQRTAEGFAPQYGQMAQGQLGNLLNMGMAGSEFQSGNQWKGLNYQLQQQQLEEMIRQFNQQSGFDFFRDVLPGLLSAGGSMGAAALL